MLLVMWFILPWKQVGEEDKGEGDENQPVDPS